MKEYTFSNGARETLGGLLMILDGLLTMLACTGVGISKALWTIVEVVRGNWKSILLWSAGLSVAAVTPFIIVAMSWLIV